MVGIQVAMVNADIEAKPDGMKANRICGFTRMRAQRGLQRRCASGRKGHQPEGRFPSIGAQTAEFAVAAQHLGLGR
jgi:hypothetical protein